MAEGLRSIDQGSPAHAGIDRYTESNIQSCKGFPAHAGIDRTLDYFDVP